MKPGIVLRFYDYPGSCRITPIINARQHPLLFVTGCCHFLVSSASQRALPDVRPVAAKMRTQVFEPWLAPAYSSLTEPRILVPYGCAGAGEEHQILALLMSQDKLTQT